MTEPKQAGCVPTATRNTTCYYKNTTFDVDIKWHILDDSAPHNPHPAPRFSVNAGSSEKDSKGRIMLDQK